MLSVATLLALAYGTRVKDAHDRGIAPSNLRSLRKTLAPNHRDTRSRLARTVSVSRHGVDWLRRMLLRGRLWDRVWLLPEQLPKPNHNLEVVHQALSQQPYIPLSRGGITQVVGAPAAMAAKDAFMPRRG